jgi:hypothetical protein
VSEGAMKCMPEGSQMKSIIALTHSLTHPHIL